MRPRLPLIAGIASLALLAGCVAAVIEDFPNIRPVTRQNYRCNQAKVPGVAVIYRSVDGLTGADRFRIEGVGPMGGLFRVEYPMTVEPSGNGTP
jgi:hypothetical protein